MWEKLGGFAVIVATITVLCLISLTEPSVVTQLIFGLIGSFLCLIGIVFLFAEGQLLSPDHWLRKGIAAFIFKRAR